MCYNTERVSYMLWPINAKIVEQMQQIKNISDLLGKKSNDYSLPMESKNKDVKSINCIM